MGNMPVGYTTAPFKLIPIQNMYLLIAGIVISALGRLCFEQIVQ